MDNSKYIIAFAGNPGSGTRTLKSKLIPFFPLPWIWRSKTYQYSGFHFLITDMESSHFPEHQLPTAIVLVCSALHLEQGLCQLKELLSLDQVKDQSIPVILCISFWEKAEKRGILIDTSLLQDVLQIPVVPCCSCCKAQLDDVKAAIHYSLQPANQKGFYYQCLDFSPGKLARECIIYTETIPPANQPFPDRLATCPLTIWLLFLATLFSVFWILL